jgi:hypothetical protein
MSQCQFKLGGRKKYILTEDFRVKLHFDCPDVYGDKIFIQDGWLYIAEGYEWDGPSGIAIDTVNFMNGSLIHDALYDLMRQDKLSRWKYRRKADKEMRIQCKKDGMSLIRRWYTWGAVRLLGHGAAGGTYLGIL